jgi:hypothetical protein
VIEATGNGTSARQAAVRFDVGVSPMRQFSLQSIRCWQMIFLEQSELWAFQRG